MDVNPIVHIAHLIGEAGRIRMLTELLDGGEHSASRLATAADVSRQTASSHLAKLREAGLIVAERQGRQRLFRLRDRDVAAAIEALAALAQPSGKRAMPEIRFARTCFDHLAGVLAIAVRDELSRIGAVREQAGGGFTVTPAGKRVLSEFDIDADALEKLRRGFANKCLDWTERHHHIGGAVGAALLDGFLRRKWLARIRGARALSVTNAGERGFEQVFNIRCARLRAQAAQPSK